jgi:hypothetical protein
MAKNATQGVSLSLPIGLRNNNPGNLAPGKILYNNQSGVDKKGYAIFPTMNDGITALITDLKYKINNRNLTTLRKLFVRYLDVPNSHTMEDANDYASFVNKKIAGSSIDAPITAKQTFDIANAIALYENGPAQFWPTINEAFQAYYNKYKPETIAAQEPTPDNEGNTQPGSNKTMMALSIAGLLAAAAYFLPKILKRKK